LEEHWFLPMGPLAQASLRDIETASISANICVMAGKTNYAVFHDTQIDGSSEKFTLSTQIRNWLARPNVIQKDKT